MQQTDLDKLTGRLDDLKILKFQLEHDLPKALEKGSAALTRSSRRHLPGCAPPIEIDDFTLGTLLAIARAAADGTLVLKEANGGANQLRGSDLLALLMIARG